MKAGGLSVLVDSVSVTLGMLQLVFSPCENPMYTKVTQRSPSLSTHEPPVSSQLPSFGS